MQHSTIRACLAPALLAVSAVLASAQTSRDLDQMPLEELMRLNVQRVFGASDRLQPVTEAPSAITIVTSDEIARYGYRTLADILRGVRGFYVTNDRNYSYVGARGLNRPGDYNTRVLLLVNGHRINDNVYDQASVGSELAMDPAMFERVEIIRGPASSLYGTNALFAIVNIVTRSGASMNGATLDVDGGTLGTRLVRGSVGRRLKRGIDFALSGTYEGIDGPSQLYIPTFADTNGGLAENLDGEKAGQIYGRLSAGDLTITGTFGRRSKFVPTASFFTAFNTHDPAEQTKERRGMLSAQYVHAIGATRVSTEASLDEFRYDGVYPYPGEDPQGPTLPYHDGFEGLRWTLSGRATRPVAGGQTITVGGEFVDNVNQNQWGNYSYVSDENFVLEQSSRQGGVYVQDEVKLRPWLLVNAGLRHDRYANFTRTTPRGSVIVMPTPNHSLKYVYGRAFRAPNAYELYYYRDASSYLQPESIATHEWVWEAYFGERLRTAVSTYRYHASQLVDLRLDPNDPTADGFGFGNDGEIRATGLELEGEVRLKHGMQALGSYALQDAKDAATGAGRLTNSPRHMAKARLSIPGPKDRSFASFEWQYLSARGTLAGTVVDPAAVANATFSYPLGRSVTLTGTIRNLFDAAYSDPASDEHSFDSIQQNGRTARIGVRWTFWSPK